MAQRYNIRKAEIWAREDHPAKGLAQARRNSQPMDRKAFLRANLQVEFSKVLRLNGIPARFCDDETGKLAEALARQLRMYLCAAHLIEVEIVEGMTIGRALDVATEILAAELQRRRLAQIAAAATLKQA